MTVLSVKLAEAGSAGSSVRASCTGMRTGAASGIGLSTAEAFARNGAAVALNHLPEDPRGPRELESLKAQGWRVVAAPGAGDDTIADLAGQLPGERLVVTADTELRRRCQAAGAAVTGPRWLTGQLGPSG